MRLPAEGLPRLTNRLLDRSTIRPEIAALLRRGKAELIAAMAATARVLHKGEILVAMHQPHDFVYAVASGWLCRNRTLPDGRRQNIVIYLPGEVCGIKSIFLTHQQDAIEAITPAAVRRLPHEAACRLIAKDFAVGIYLAWRLAEDERHLHNWNVRLGQANAEERLAAFLLELRNRLRLRGMSDGRRYGFPLTRQQLADHLGLTAVHTGRVLRRFRQRGIVSIERNQVVLLQNAHFLEEIARPIMDVAESDGEDILVDQPPAR